jgi:hypothetical protein
MTDRGALPQRFVDILTSLRDAEIPPEAKLTEIPAPQRIAPYAVALDAQVAQAHRELATGSFIVLHDPQAPPVWDGDTRVVTLVKADLESEMGADPLLGEVAWTWLAEALDSIGPLPAALSGTVTRTLGESFGGLRPMGSSVGIEVRAAWTPATGSVGADLTAWLAFLARVGGLEPLPVGVARLPAWT